MRVDPQRHLSDETVLDFVSGRLDETDGGAVHAHIDRCASCRALVAAAAARNREESAVGGMARTERVFSDAPSVSGAVVATRVEGSSPKASGLPRVGETIDEYVIRDVLGRGGMGVVYVAHDTLLDRPIALKVISVGADPALRERLLVEARAAARIKHPNVVSVYRVGEHDGQPFIAYELVRGQAIRELRRPTPWPKALELAIGITRGLAAVHARGILHRDVTPGNVLLTETGEVVLVDFGLAKIAAEPAPGVQPAASEGEVDPGVTAPGTIMGTPRYMAPEAWRGEPATPQSDLYALGVVLYELIAGRTPFGDARGTELGARVVSQDAPSLGAVAVDAPIELVAIVDRCLRREPVERPRSADALRAELETLEVQKSLARASRSLAPTPAALARPYPGRAPYGPDDAAVFFGRRSETRALLERLHASPFVLVVGSAGCGKTSLCRAGLLPLISRGILGEARRWSWLELPGGADLMAAAAAAITPHTAAERADVERLVREDPAAVATLLARGHRQVLCSGHLVYVDALDDKLATATPADARAFADLVARLGDPSPGIRLLGTARTATLDRLAAHPALAAHLGPALYFLTEPRTEECLRDIVAAPAQLAGRALDERTVTTLVRAGVAGELSLSDLSARLADRWVTGAERAAADV